MPREQRHADRRTFLAAVGSAAIAVAAAPAPAAAQDLAATEQANRRLIDEFCRAWTAPLDLDRIGGFLADDAVYRATETAPPVKGRDAIVERLRGMLGGAREAEFEVVQTHASGPVVINERFDRFAVGERRIEWHGVGVFYIRGGKIVEWSDYTIR